MLRGTTGPNQILKAPRGYTGMQAILALENLPEPSFLKKDEDKKINNKNSDPILVKNVKGFAMFLNMPEFQNVGFFDENFFIYFEEMDLCKRLVNY